MQSRLLPEVVDQVLVEDPAQDGRIATQKEPKPGDKVIQGTKLEVVLYVFSATPKKTP